MQLVDQSLRRHPGALGGQGCQPGLEAFGIEDAGVAAGGEEFVQLHG
jgi:hypothetical protein